MTLCLSRRRRPASLALDTSGATTVEYALLLSLVVLLAAGAVRHFGDSVRDALRFDLAAITDDTGSGGASGSSAGNGGDSDTASAAGAAAGSFGGDDDDDD